MKERSKLFIILAVFAACWFLPVDNLRFMQAIDESLRLLKWYAREHVLLCLVPAFFIAGAISTFVSQGAVMRYLGPQASKWVAYPVAAASGTILAVCSCTVLPLFASIHKRGAGLGPATAFLYSGPAINILAMILTARVLGFELGIARAVGAVLFAVVIGVSMQFLFRHETDSKIAKGLVTTSEATARSSWQDGLYFAVMVGILVFANWGAARDDNSSVWSVIYHYKWYISAFLLFSLGVMLLRWFKRDELVDWVDGSWFFVKQIMPLLFAGVLLAGFFLGGPEGGHGIIPDAWIERLVGGNSFTSVLFASVAGAFMYFATLTEVPILQGLLAAGMGKGPALALLLAGPALSLPNMLVIRGVMGTKKTVVYVALVVVLSTAAGTIYGSVF